MNTLIVDSGSTKSIWALVKKEGVKTIEIEGINPYYQTEEEILDIISQQVKPKITEEIENCFFYGAGCTHTRYTGKLKRSIKKVFNARHVEVKGDLLGAARASCQTEAGIVAIMGTGSISGYYDGEEITEKVPALGYVLGDEGSGTAIGKRFLKQYLRGEFSLELREKLRKLNIEEHEVIEKVYTKPFPNRYLASFVKQLTLLQDDPEIEAIILESFREFFVQHIERYPDVNEVYLVGSIAWGFKPLMEVVAEEYGVVLKKVLKNPMEGLIAYHVSE